MRLLYIIKKPTTNNWSNVLLRQFESFDLYSGGKTDLFYVNTSSLYQYFKNIFLIVNILKKGKHQIVYVNHIICAYPFLLALLLIRTKLVKVLALHETEPVLGSRFIKENRKRLTWKQRVRYTKLLVWPVVYFDKTLILNSRQKLMKNASYVQMNFLGVAFDDKPAIQRLTPGGVIQLFFPHNVNRPEKGFDFAEGALKRVKFPYNLRIGGNIPHEEMKRNYESSDVVLLTGAYETYSLVLLEAMTANCFVIATREVGLIENLLEKYSNEQLESFGIHVVDQDVSSIQFALEKLHAIVFNGVKARTRELVVQEKLTEDDCNRRLYDFLTQIHL